jgi:hypothetical protein
VTAASSCRHGERISERETGRRPLPTYLDDSATHLDTFFVGAGRGALEIELASDDLISLTDATVQKLRRNPAADRPAC